MVEKFLQEKLRIRNKTVREFFAEFLGTFLLISFGDGSVAQFVLGREQYGTFLTVNWAWGLAVAMGVWASGGVSGGHINPAVSLTMAILGRLSWGKMLVYMLAQYTGAFTASACVYGVYYDALEAFDNGTRAVGGELDTAGIWSTYPQDYLSTASGFGDQVFGTALLLICILSITDNKNMSPPRGMTPICVGLSVVVIGMSYGVNCGYAINPARDLAPRLFTAAAGWGWDTFSFRDYNWFWVPIVGPHVGAILGAFVYVLLVGIHFPEDEDADEYEISIDKNGDIDITGVNNRGYKSNDGEVKL